VSRSTWTSSLQDVHPNFRGPSGEFMGNRSHPKLTPPAPIHARRAVLGAALALSAAVFASPAKAEGTWEKAPASASNHGPAFGLWLLTDGTVLSHGNGLNDWVILTPDSSGNYANGTWKTVASSAFARGGAQEHVLKDGRFFEAGGEFLYAWPAHDGVAACATNCTNPPSGSPLFKNAEIYDPVANTWTVEADGLYDIGDTASATMSDGRVLDSTRVSNAIQIYDPTMNTWTAGTSETNPNGDESAWATLQNGGVLAVSPMQTSIYNPASSSWVRTGALPAGFAVTLTAASGYPGTYDFGDTAGISQMFDGRVLAYGLGTTAIYTPGATASDPGTWALGPNMPYKTGPLDGTPGNECEDEYTVTEPNGKVMVATHPFGDAIDTLQEFDPTTNTIATIDFFPDPQGGDGVGSYLNLPNGQVMTTGASSDWLYTPDSLPQDSWRPTVTSVTFNSGTTYTLTGTQLSGLINGGDEGDDMTSAENYPIVWLTDSANHVYYCKSFNFSNMTPSPGSTPETCQFTTPAGLADGTYNLFVSAVGVQSKVAFSFTTGTSATADAGTDAGPDATTMIGSDGGISADGGTVSTDGATLTAEGGVVSNDSGQGVASDGGGAASDAASGGAGDSGVGNDVGSPSGCGCRTVRDSSSRDGSVAFGLVGLAVAARRRRIRRVNAEHRGEGL
jgi:MYXO-CTERM domain-containing protein